jgi:hypothetical protein
MQMTREEALKRIKRFYGEALEEFVGETEDYDALDMAIETLEQTQWIPCSKRLPKEGEVVLICVQFEYSPKMFVASRQDHNYWTGVGARFAKEMVAWMPLPKPWNGWDDE